MFKNYYKIFKNIKYITKYKLFNTHALFSLLSYFLFINFFLDSIHKHHTNTEE